MTTRKSFSKKKTSKKQTKKSETTKVEDVGNATGVKVYRHPSAKLPEYKTSGAAGCDLHANISLPMWIDPGEVKMIPTGLQVDIPKGYCLKIYPRSGLAVKKGLTVLNAPGLIDEDFHSEIQVILVNHSKEKHQINRHDRIAQMMIEKVEKISWEPLTKEQYDELIEEYQGDRSGGFGSTGQ